MGYKGPGGENGSEFACEASLRVGREGQEGEWLHELHHRDPRDYSGKDKLSDVTRDYDQVWGAHKYS